MEEWGEQCGEHCRNPLCRFRAKRAESRETGAGFGIPGFENPRPPIFMNFGRRGRAGEPGGTWGAAQGPGGDGGEGARRRVPRGIRQHPEVFGKVPRTC